VENKNNGSYNAKSLPTKSGDYEVRVTVDDKAVRTGPSKISYATH